MRRAGTTAGVNGYGAANGWPVPAPLPAYRPGLIGELSVRELNEQLAPHGLNLAGVIAGLLRRLHDGPALDRYCRALAFACGANVLQAALVKTLKHIGREGLLRS